MISKQQLVSAALGAALAALAFLIAQLGWLDGIELKTLDFRFHIRGSITPQAPIVLVSIDQDSFDELQLPWPWPRTLHADLVRKLAKNGAKIIGLDILFTEPKADALEDRELGAAIKEAGNVILGAEYTEVSSDFGPRTTLNLPIPELRDGALGHGLVNVITDKDGIVRHAQPALSFQQRDFPSFALRIYQSVRPDAPLKTTLAPYLINFRGPARTYATVPYYRVLRNEIDGSFFNGKIVLIGAFAASLHDVFPTPFSARYQTAGVEIQANFLETLLMDDHIGRLAGWQTGLLFCVLTALTIWTAMRLAPFKAAAVVGLLAGLFAAACIFFFVQGRVWLPMTPALFGILLSYGGLTLQSYITEQRERLRYRAQFMKYVSPDVVEEILQNREGLALGGKRRHITVLFADVRGFTSISERIKPEEVVSFLDEYFAQVTQIVFKYGGTVDKFMGDGVMAIFGAPKSHLDDAARAVKTGLEMIQMVEAKSQEWTKVLGNPPAVGIGINSGDAVVGRIGSELRSDYTAIGDTVNLASRLEALTKELSIPLLVSETAAAEVSEEIGLKPLRRVKVVGRETPLLVYTAAHYVEAASKIAPTNEPYMQQHK
jgi:adenylate cyclase